MRNLNFLSDKGALENISYVFYFFTTNFSNINTAIYISPATIPNKITLVITKSNLNT